MFSKQRHDHLDLSIDLQQAQDWKPAILRRFEYPLKVTALAYEPIAGLLAVGTPGSIELLGKPGVECKLILPDPHSEVKILHISASAFKLLCLDDHDKLHIWDLTTYGLPKLLTSTRFKQANSVTISPSHSHAFIALQSGEIQTYDLECLRKSSYSMPSMWALYEEKMAISGMPEIATPTSGIALDTLVHPRDLNLMFVVYGGGIVLSDLSERSTVRTYELVFLPGAPGGTGYGSSDVLTHRRPEATCMAIHPAGHFFAVGHADGSIAFWAVEDEDKPLLVRTLDDVDVHDVDAEQLEAHLAQASKAESGREPVFKLSWCSFPNSSDPRGGETALVILGGLGPKDSPGITIYWLPAFNPVDPPTAQPSTLGLHPSIRSSMRSSVEPLDTYFYEANGIVHDYILTPRDSPHFAGACDPTSIISVIESRAGTRVVEAYQFPPPALTQHVHTNTETISQEERDTLDDLATTLQDLQMNNEPGRLKLPSYLTNSSHGFLGGRIYTVTKDAYMTLNRTDDAHVLPLRAGFAWLDRVENVSKYQPPRIFITWYRDLSVQLWDVSAQLLQKFKPEPLDCDFPNLLPNLVIDIDTVLTAASVMPKISNQHPFIQSAEIATESLECAIILSTGMVIVYRLDPPSANTFPFEELPDAELLFLKHLSTSLESRFSPYFALFPDRGQVSACAIADVGFLAVAYADGSLYVVNMRGPNIILRQSKNKARYSIGINLGSETDAISTLQWTISPIETDKHLALRLIAGRISGTSQVFTFGRTADSSWAPIGEAVRLDCPVHPVAFFVLDNKNGIPCGANRSRLAASLEGLGTTAHDQVLLVAVGGKGARCNVDITGDRLSKVEWNHKMGQILSVQIVQKLSSYALVAFTENHEVYTYSLPDLEYMHTIALPEFNYLQITVDETGDFFVWDKEPKTGLVRQAAYGTLFNFRRIESTPAIDLLSSKPVVPPQPQPVSVGPTSILGSWFKFGQSMTGAQVDTLLGGPDRPVPVQKAKPNVTSIESTVDPSQIAEEAVATQGTLYSRLTAALEERGQMLGDLEDRFNSLESGSRSMVDQAKRLAAEQSAKSWFKFGS